jgi:hypothetical protein
VNIAWSKKLESFVELASKNSILAWPTDPFRIKTLVSGVPKSGIAKIYLKSLSKL